MGQTFLTSGLGKGGAQPKAGNISDVLQCVLKLILRQSKLDLNKIGYKIIDNVDKLCKRVKSTKENEVVSIAYHGNVVKVWRHF